MKARNLLQRVVCNTGASPVVVAYYARNVLIDKRLREDVSIALPTGESVKVAAPRFRIGIYRRQHTLLIWP
jgi:hypothetical protein